LTQSPRETRDSDRPAGRVAGEMTAAASLCPAFTLRPAQEQDVPFITKPWLQALRQESSTRYLSDPVFFRGHGALIQRLLDRARTLIACDAEAGDHFYGFACGEPGLVHWIYVKGTYRGMGIGRALLRAIVHPLTPGEMPITTSHASHLFNDRGLVARYKITYNPYALDR
jgi:GNAT superfamily N-acetyltransferase